MSLSRVALIFLTVVSVSSCVERLPASTQVYQALFSSLGETERIFFIREEAARLPSEELSGDLRELYSNFRFPEGVEAHKKTDFGSLDVRLVSEVEYSRLFVGGCERGWKSFHGKYPEAKSLIQISAVGFRPNRDEALVYVTGGSGCLAGSGYLILLQKKSGRWAVVKEFNLWVA